MDVSDSQSLKVKQDNSNEQLSNCSPKNESEKSSSRFPLARGVITVVCCLLLNLTLGITYSSGNLSPYLTSYLRNCTGDTSLDYSMTLWVDLSGFTFGSLALPFLGVVEQRIPNRIYLIIGWILFTASLLCNYWAVQISFIATVLMFGLPQGLGQFIIMPSSSKLGIKWFPERKGLVNGIVMAGYGGGALFWNQMITAWINPDNLQPDETIGENLYFTQREVLKRLPSCYLLLGGVLGGIQLLCLIFISYPPSPSPSTLVTINVTSATELGATSDNEIDVTSANETGIRSDHSHKTDVMAANVKSDVTFATVTSDVTSTSVEGTTDVIPLPVETADVISPTAEATINVTSTSAEVTDVTPASVKKDVRPARIEATNSTSASVKETTTDYIAEVGNTQKTGMTIWTPAGMPIDSPGAGRNRAGKSSGTEVVGVDVSSSTGRYVADHACTDRSQEMVNAFSGKPVATREAAFKDNSTEMVSVNVSSDQSAEEKDGAHTVGSMEVASVSDDKTLAEKDAVLTGSGKEMVSVDSFSDKLVNQKDDARFYRNVGIVNVSLGADNLAGDGNPEEGVRPTLEIGDDLDDEASANKMTFLEIVRSRAMITLFIQNFTLDLGFQLIKFYHKAYAQTFIHDDHLLSLASSMAPAFNALARPLWGLLSDRCGLMSAYLLSLTTLSCMASTFLLCEWGGTVMFFVWLCTIYFAVSGVYSLLNPIIYDLFGSRNFILALGIVFSEAVVLSPALVYVSSALQHSFGWHGLFIFAGALVFLSLAIAASFVLDCGHPLSPRMQRALFARRPPLRAARAADEKL